MDNSDTSDNKIAKNISTCINKCKNKNIIIHGSKGMKNNLTHEDTNQSEEERLHKLSLLQVFNGIDKITYLPNDSNIIIKSKSDKSFYLDGLVNCVVTLENKINNLFLRNCSNCVITLKHTCIAGINCLKCSNIKMKADYCNNLFLEYCNDNFFYFKLNFMSKLFSIFSDYNHVNDKYLGNMYDIIIIEKSDIINYI